MKILGNSEFGKVAICDKCNTVFYMDRYSDCPHCWLVDFNDRSKKPPYPGGGRGKAFHRKVY